MTVNRLLRELDSREITEWQIWYRMQKRDSAEPDVDTLKAKMKTSIGQCNAIVAAKKKKKGK